MENIVPSTWRAVLALGAFVLACIGLVLYLFSGTQLSVPVVEEPLDYKVSVVIQDTDNLVPAGVVRIAGVEVGEILKTERVRGGIKAVLGLDDVAAPLHQGVRIRIGARSVVGETYLDVRDGTGPAIPPETMLPQHTVERSVQLRDVLATLDDETQGELSGMIRSLGAGTKGTKSEIAAILEGLGKLGREGQTALDAIAAQSGDLRALVRETATLMSALDTSQGAIAELVSSSEKITSATAGQRQAIEASMRKLPNVLESANDATTELVALGNALRPVAADLKQAAPFLSAAFAELPATTKDLRGLLPALNGTLDRAPATLKRVPTFGQDVRTLIPDANAVLRDVNPMLEYIRPYGPEMGAFFANFNAILGYTDEAGVHYARLLILLNGSSVQQPVDSGATIFRNPYPKPGAGTEVRPFDGKYPHVKRAPR